MRFTWVDVFAQTPLTGNPLCVFTAAADTPFEQMARVTRELNHSETTFLQPASDPAATARLRILMPAREGAREIPFAGHPILGSACVAAGQAGGQVLFETGVGLISVSVTRLGERSWEARMEQPLPRPVWQWEPHRGGRCPAGGQAGGGGGLVELLAALGLPVDALRADLPIEAVTNGMPMVLIGLASPAAVVAARPDTGRLAALFGRDGECVVLFAPLSPGSEGTVKTRVFCPFDPFGEDPATGSANGPLGEYVVRHGLGTSPVVSLQGAELGRPSQLTIRVERRDGVTTGVQVAGRVWQVAGGEFEWA